MIGNGSSAVPLGMEKGFTLPSFESTVPPQVYRALSTRLNHCIESQNVDDLLQLLLDIKGVPELAEMGATIKLLIGQLLSKKPEQDSNPRNSPHNQFNLGAMSGTNTTPSPSTGSPHSSASLGMPVSPRQESTFVMEVMSGVVGWVIGRSGSRIKEMQAHSGCKMWIDQDVPNHLPRKLYFHGHPENIEIAVQLVNELLQAAPILVGRHGTVDSLCSVIIDCPAEHVGFLIGKKGWTIKKIMGETGAQVSINQSVKEGCPRKIVVSGAKDCVAIAERLIRGILRARPEDLMASMGSEEDISLHLAQLGFGTAVSASPASMGQSHHGSGDGLIQLHHSMPMPRQTRAPTHPQYSAKSKVSPPPPAADSGYGSKMGRSNHHMTGGVMSKQPYPLSFTKASAPAPSHHVVEHHYHHAPTAQDTTNSDPVVKQSATASDLLQQYHLLKLNVQSGARPANATTSAAAATGKSNPPQSHFQSTYQADGMNGYNHYSTDGSALSYGSTNIMGASYYDRDSSSNSNNDLNELMTTSIANRISNDNNDDGVSVENLIHAAQDISFTIATHSNNVHPSYGSHLNQSSSSFSTGFINPNNSNNNNDWSSLARPPASGNNTNNNNNNENQMPFHFANNVNSLAAPVYSNHSTNNNTGFQSLLPQQCHDFANISNSSPRSGYASDTSSNNSSRSINYQQQDNNNNSTNTSSKKYEVNPLTVQTIMNNYSNSSNNATNNTMMAAFGIDTSSNTINVVRSSSGSHLQA